MRKIFLNQLKLFSSAATAAGALHDQHETPNDDDDRKGHAGAFALEHAENRKKHDDADGNDDDRTGHVVRAHATRLASADACGIFRSVLVYFFVHRCL